MFEKFVIFLICGDVYVNVVHFVFLVVEGVVGVRWGPWARRYAVVFCVWVGIGWFGGYCCYMPCVL